MQENVLYAKPVNTTILLTQVCYKPCKFHPKYGRMIPWILLRDSKVYGQGCNLCGSGQNEQVCARHDLNSRILVVAQIYLDHVFKLHGMPNSIVKNKDAVCMTLFWQESYSNIFRIFHTSNNLQKFKQCKKKAKIQNFKI